MKNPKGRKAPDRCKHGLKKNTCSLCKGYPQTPEKKTNELIGTRDDYHWDLYDILSRDWFLGDINDENA